MNIIDNQRIFLNKMEQLKSIVDINARFPLRTISKEFSEICFVNFDDIFTQEFFEGLRSFLIAIKESNLTYAVLDPKPEEYFFSHFHKYPFLDFNIDTSSQEFLADIEADPGDSPADAIVYNSNVIVIFGANARWVIYADRDYEVAIVGSVRLDVKEAFIRGIGQRRILDAADVVEQILPLIYPDSSTSKYLDISRQIRTNYI